MKPIFSALCALFLVGCATTSDVHSTRPLQGQWLAVSATINGKELPPDVVNSLRLTLTELRFKTERGTETLFDSTYSVDSSKTPNEINMIGNEGDLTGKEAFGIYELSGDDLRLCYTMPGSPRPARFASAPGSGAYLITWKKAR